MQQNHLDLHLKYFFHYKPNLFLNRKASITTNGIFIKNFFFIIFFLNYCFNQKKIQILYYINKNYKTKFKINIIRAPQRYKKSIIKIKKENYNFTIKLRFILFSKLKSNLTLYRFFKKNFFFFESSLFFLKNIQLLLRVNFSLFLYC